MSLLPPLDRHSRVLAPIRPIGQSALEFRICRHRPLSRLRGKRATTGHAFAPGGSPVWFAEMPLDITRLFDAWPELPVRVAFGPSRPALRPVPVNETI